MPERVSNITIDIKGASGIAADPWHHPRYQRHRG